MARDRTAQLHGGLEHRGAEPGGSVPASDDHAGALYKIGAVAKRTGISAERLRAWERRYGLEPAARAGHTRFYSRAQVGWLADIKTLLDQGHPISQVIQLDEGELQRRLQPPRLRAAHAAGGRIGIVGGQLIHAYRSAPSPALAVAAEWATLADLADDAGALPRVQAVVAYLPSLDPQRIALLEELYPATRIAVAFKYATAADLDHCRASGHALLRWPAEWASVEKLVQAGQALSPPAQGERLFSDEELVHIQLMAPNAAGEPAGHLARLVGELNDLSSHVQRDGDEDHRLVDAGLDAARAQLEATLQALVEKHGLLTTAN